MAKVINFEERKKNEEKVAGTKAIEDYTEGASFWDEQIDPSIVFDVINNDKMRLAFVTMLVVLRQISTMGEFHIAIDEDGVRFDSSNSIAIDEPDGYYQVHSNLMKQGFLPIGYDHSLIDLQQAADSLGMILQALILYREEELHEVTDDTE